MSMKPGDDQSLGVNLAFGRRLGNPSDADDPIATHGDVTVKPRIAGAVHDPPIADQQVNRLRSWVRPQGIRS